MNLSTTVILAGGPGSGCHGENCGRPTLHDTVREVTKNSQAWHNVWGDLAKYGHLGKTEPFTKEEQATLKKLKGAVGQCKVGYCFMNAQRLAVSAMHLRLNNVRYVEGLVTVHGVPLDHAWIELNGKVYDPTLANEKWKMKQGKVERGEYLGIDVPKEEIELHQMKVGKYAPLSHSRDEGLRNKIWK